MNESKNNKKAKRNIVILILIQALAGGMIPMHFFLAGIAGYKIAPYPLLATMPVSMTILGGMLASPIITRLSLHYGRRIAFFVATFIAALGLVWAGLGIKASNFPVFVFASALIGFYVAAQGMFRFAATDAATTDWKSKALSYTLIGGLIAVFVGLRLGKSVPDDALYLAYFWMLPSVFIGMGLYFFLDLPRVESDRLHKTQGIFAYLAKNGKVQAAMALTISAYVLMNLMMTSAPLAIMGMGHGRHHGALVMMAHMISMYLPSLVTGTLISRFGALNVTLVGVVLFLLTTVIGLMGTGLPSLYAALILLGIAWNFAYVGGSALLVQFSANGPYGREFEGVNDMLMWGCVALASLASGILLNLPDTLGHQGWLYVNLAMFPILIVMFLSIGYIRKTQKQA